MSICIQSSLFGSSKSGRFGNQFFQLLFFHILSQKFNCTIRLPSWDGQGIFNNHNFSSPLFTSSIFNLEPFYSRFDGPESTFNLLKSLIEQPSHNIDIIGTFQFNTNTLYKFKDVLDSKFIFTDLANTIKLDLNSSLNHHELIAIHWREGDYNVFNNIHPYFWKPDYSKLLLEINNLSEISNNTAKIYLASDDSRILGDLLIKNNINFLTASNFTKDYNQFLLWDFIALIESDFFIASNSSLSLAAALLNKNAKFFSRAHSPTGDFGSFNPWRTEILVNQFIGN